MAEFTIVGTGLAGTLMACYLGKAGHTVNLYDRRRDPRVGEAEAGRSINLALSVRGLHALSEVGLRDEVVKSGVLMRGRMIHPKSGDLVFQRYGKDDSEALHSVSRGGLNRLLVEAAARYPHVRLTFDHRCTQVEPKDGTVKFVTPQGDKIITAKHVIGADGAFSAVRTSLQMLERFNFSQYYLQHGYKELTIPAKPGGGYHMEPNALHIWPRGDFMMIALPNGDGSFTCTLFWPYDGPHGFTRLANEREVVEYFNEAVPRRGAADAESRRDVLAKPSRLAGDDSLSAVAHRRERRAHRRRQPCRRAVPRPGHERRVRGLHGARGVRRQASDSLNRLMREYESRRKVHADVLADLCFENFIEMRDKVGSKLFLLKKYWQLLLYKIFPNWYKPLYTMIEFTRIPYADALARSKRQDRIVNVVLVIAALAILFALYRWLK